LVAAPGYWYGDCSVRFCYGPIEIAQQEPEPKSESIIEIASLSEQAQLVLVEQREQDASTSSAPYGKPKDLATVFFRLCEIPTFPLNCLSRYEHLLWRQARQLVFTLDSLRRRVLPRSRLSFPFSFRARGM
jgi:hypothetical protein